MSGTLNITSPILLSFPGGWAGICLRGCRLPENAKTAADTIVHNEMTAAAV